MFQLDQTDLKILSILQSSSNYTTKQLAALVNLSSTPVYERVKRLEKEGYIRKYVAILNHTKLNQGFMVFCNVKLKQINPAVATKFTNQIKKINEVTECYNISGEYDYLLKIQAPDMKYYQHFLIHELGKIECIGGIQSVFVMDEIKHSYGINID